MKSQFAATSANIVSEIWCAQPMRILHFSAKMCQPHGEWAPLRLSWWHKFILEITERKLIIAANFIIRGNHPLWCRRRPCLSYYARNPFWCSRRFCANIMSNNDGRQAIGRFKGTPPHSLRWLCCSKARANVDVWDWKKASMVVLSFYYFPGTCWMCLVLGPRLNRRVGASLSACSTNDRVGYNLLIIRSNSDW